MKGESDLAGFKLTSDERRRVLAGDHSSLRRRHEPQCEIGDVIVVMRSREHKHVVGKDSSDPQVVVTPPQPLFWIEVTDKLRHRSGDHLVRFAVHDRRQPVRMLVGPPSRGGGMSDEAARGYGSSRTGAVDDLEAVDDAELARQRAQAKERWNRHQEDVASEERDRQQVRAIRERIKQEVSGFDSETRAYVLARIEAVLEEARTTMREAA